MLVPLSWIKDYVDIDDIPIEELAHQITMAGLEVEEILYVGLPLPTGATEGRSGGHARVEFKTTGLAWDPELIVVAEVSAVNPHPDADRLVLCELNDGERDHTVLTGAPNLFPYKGKGTLETPLKVAYAKLGAVIYDGHKPGLELTKLKKAKIRGVESYSMICSEKELGISEEHEGIMFLPEDAPTGMPLADYMGDAVLDIAITPNIARNANMLGVAREIAALTKRELRKPSLEVRAEGGAVKGKADIQITNPELNPRFVLGLIENIEIKPSPDWVRRRLNMAGMRPISNIVDATNYTMLELGEPLHAFDYDVLLDRAGGKMPTIITRPAETGEKLTTLDEIERTLDDFTTLVCDQKGALAMAGVMGGLESEISDSSRTVLLEGASWNLINVRKTLSSQKMGSEAAYRFSRGVHPAIAPRAVKRCLELMRQWSGGVVYDGLIDNYPLPAVDSTVAVTPADVRRSLGIELKVEEIADILKRLEFAVKVSGDEVSATTPDHRLDVGTGLEGVADLMEEIARIYGYENIPETRLDDALPPQRNNPRLALEENSRDLLAKTGLQEIITYRLTSVEREQATLAPDSAPDDTPWLGIKNPISPEKHVLRKNLLTTMLEVVERNAKNKDRIAIFELGPVFIEDEGASLPLEQNQLAVALCGKRALADWQAVASENMDFYDLKGVLEQLFDGLHLSGLAYESYQHPSFHPGKCARVLAGETQIAVAGEIHPQVKEQFALPDAPVLMAAINMDIVRSLVPDRHDTMQVSAYPPVLEDLALIVAEDMPAGTVEALIKQTGGKLLVDVRLFDVYRGENIGAGKKSLAYSLTYQAPDRTLTDKDAEKLRRKIAKRLERELDAKIRMA